MTTEDSWNIWLKFIKKKSLLNLRKTSETIPECPSKLSLGGFVSLVSCFLFVFDFVLF